VSFERRLERLEEAAYGCPDCEPTLERLLEAIADEVLQGGEDLSEVPDRCPTCGRKVLTFEVIDRILAEVDEEEGGEGTT